MFTLIYEFAEISLKEKFYVNGSDCINKAQVTLQYNVSHIEFRDPEVKDPSCQSPQEAAGFWKEEIGVPEYTKRKEGEGTTAATTKTKV